MATSAFKSTTRRQSTPDSATLRRSRSLTRRPEYEQNARNGKFVNTERGGGGFSAGSSFPDMSLDDLAIEFFSSSSFNEEDNNRNRTERIGRWATDTASSRRRGRSVSRARVDDTRASVKQPLARRRRSLSTAPIGVDSESDVDRSRVSSNRSNVKTPTSGNKHASLLPNAKSSSNRQPGRSISHRDTSVFHEGYSSHSSALTDEESKDACILKNGSEKIIRTVYTRNKAENPANDVANGGLYEAMRKELRYAVDEIRTELNQAVGRTHTTSASDQCYQSDTSSVPQDLNGIGDYCVPKLEKCKDDLTVMSNEECDLEVSRKVKDLPNSRFSSATQRHLRGRKRSTDRSKSTKRLIEEAERIIEDFVSNVEDSDLSSFDGERSDCSSLGGVMKSRNAVTREAENFKIPAGSAFCTDELDGINLPWLQWEAETSADCSHSGKNNVTPTALKRESEKAAVSLNDPSGYSVSSHGSWSPGLFNSPASRSEINRQSEQVGNTTSSFDMEEYLGLEKADKILFEMYIQRNRISAGGIFLCSSLL